VDSYFAPGKAALLSVGEQIDTRSAAGRLVLNVLASVSQCELEAIGERTATAMQNRASTPVGKRHTGAGWGPMANASRRMPGRHRRVPSRGSCGRRGCRYEALPQSWSGEGCGAGPGVGSRRYR